MIVTPSLPSAPLTRAGHELRRLRHGREVGRIGAVDVVGVGARDHEHVAVAGREDVEERDGALVLVDALGGHRPGHDAAEDAVAHGVEGYGRAAGSAVNERIASASGTITQAASAQATNACDGASL